MLGTYHMQALLTGLSDLHYIHEADQLYSFVVNRSCEVLKAQGGTFFLVKEAEQALYPVAAKGVSLSLLQEIPFKMKGGVAGWVATNKKPALIDNAETDDRFNKSVDVITGLKTRSVVCVPVMRQQRIMGVMQLINRVDGKFFDADVEFLSHFSSQAAVAMENARLYAETNDLLAYTNSVINSLTGGFISTNNQGVVTRCNVAACRILGVSHEKVINRVISEGLPQFSEFGAILENTQKNESPVQRKDISLKKADGSDMILGYSTFLIRNDIRKILGAGVVFQDITKLLKK